MLPISDEGPRRTVARFAATRLDASALITGAVGEVAVHPVFSVDGFTGALDEPAEYEPQTSFRAGPQSGVVAFRDLILATCPATRSLGINRAADLPGRSEHKEGRAWDWGVSKETDGEVVAELLDWLLAPDQDSEPFAAARRFGIMYMIWDRRIWGSYAAEEGWRPYRGPNPHTDHVHFSFSWRGALGLTSWWAARVPHQAIANRV